jgi:hypothetical protein
VCTAAAPTVTAPAYINHRDKGYVLSIHHNVELPYPKLTEVALNGDFVSLVLELKL